MALILWLMHESRVTPKAINRHKITLELSQIQTLPPNPPGAKPIPKVPPRPKPVPRPKPTPRPLPNPTPKPRPAPVPKKTETAKEPEKKTAKGTARKNPLLADANRTKIQNETNTSKKVIVMKITPKKRKEEAKKKPKKPVARRIARQTPPPPKSAKSVPRKKTPPPRKSVKRRPPRRHTPRGPDSRLISSLYGSSYSRMSSAQRRFIDENLRRILQISQRTLNYLGYPREAARFGEQGTNIVEFWLYPNGDISGLRLRRRLNSRSLNHQTLEVIKTAYMNYPRPKVKTKIIIYVRYRLY